MQELEIPIDDLDLQILKELKRDARLSYRKMADKLKVATGTVQARINRLENIGIIKDYHASIDYNKLGYYVTAVIACTVKRKSMDEFVKEIGKHPNVFGVFSVTGEYDMFISVKFKDMDDLNKFVIGELAEEFIDKSVTFLVLKTHKEAHTFLIE
jgi:DNA-binding Lrp family transcriptional regulator